MTHHNVDRIIGKRLREIRTAQSFTITQMADRTQSAFGKGGYTVESIRDAEHGRSTFTIQKIIILAHAYNCPYSYLVKNLPDPVEDGKEDISFPGQQKIPFKEWTY